jgi:hypothetical protein
MQRINKISQAIGVSACLLFAGQAIAQVDDSGELETVPEEVGVQAQTQTQDAAPGAKSGMDVTQLLAQLFEKEPSVQEIQRAAVRYFRVQPERVLSLSRKAGWKHLAPDVNLSYSRNKTKGNRRMDDYFYASTVPRWPYKENEDNTNNETNMGVTLGWYLPGLIFNSEELDVQSLIGIQEGILREVTTLYYTRRRLQVNMVLNPPQDDYEKITEALRLEEITGTLDALTGGYMSRRLRASKGN